MTFHAPLTAAMNMVIDGTVLDGKHPSGPQDMSRHLPECDLPIDTGIAYAVAVLRGGGVETFESCEGGEGHAFLQPTVRFFGNSAAGYHAVSVAMDYGLPIAELQRYWSLQDGELVGPQWQMTFYKQCPMPVIRGDKDER